jgi:hypothetical protein
MVQQPRRATVDVIRRALEAAAVEFIEENGRGPGERLQKRACRSARGPDANRAIGVRGQKLWRLWRPGSGEDQFGQDRQSCTEVVPERDFEFGAGLDDAEEGVTAIAADIAAGTAAELAPGHVAADVVLRSVGVQRDLHAWMENDSGEARPDRHPLEVAMVLERRQVLSPHRHPS